MFTDGKLGHEESVDLSAPKAVAGLHTKRFVELDCGAYTTIVRDDGGHVWGWGAHTVRAKLHMARPTCEHMAHPIREWPALRLAAAHRACPAHAVLVPTWPPWCA